ncbi:MULTISPECIES: TetR/AcrR family transcriptional regulator [unclassified Mycobacterium]|uniref:TetR/AcrR family transcriptional regulator n=1 Tax=unclassified Mycobacterium TaxID=2642494 RepID=UPI0007FCAD82|nr:MULTISPECIES: TetR/AcrR family transcriptional regulator [unclassified Mycobacterium]OBG58391.1 TetR family transcriptional regulator [Mycobacterium sp. E735]OBG63201.1 TetR family transcriptional regulator [Mycobacterium sp. E188]OBG76904.1 TetR family transcriptional regulator [Mycobacterium sp. E3305]OBG94303.1 TetR family transcriptional regulator [Mycobacterium sp. E3298]OBH11193.1 TetR family transcriptional regulator [Mycobacterium sp. E1715]
MTSASAARRIGAPDAKNRGLLLDAAEQLMLEEGYAAVTSRRLANKAGLKPQLVHYYFRTMEELFLEVFRRRADEGLQAQAQLLQSPQPLWALWRFGTDPGFTRISMEFMALANHRKDMRAEIAYYAERFREEQRKAVAAALQRYGAGNEDVPAVVWTVLMTSLSRMLVLEQAIGMSGGHAETVELVEQYLRRLEGEPRPIEDVPPTWVVHQLRSEQSTPLGPSLDTTTAPSTARSQ